MKLTRENIYINLQGKSKEELTELWNFLDSIGEKQLNSIKEFLENDIWDSLHLDKDKEWSLSFAEGLKTKNKQEVTIQQLKEILQPMENKETIEQQLEKAEAEVKRLKESIEEESKPKIGDWYSNKIGNYLFKFGKEHSEAIVNKFDFFKKITDQDFINKLNELIK